MGQELLHVHGAPGGWSVQCRTTPRTTRYLPERAETRIRRYHTTNESPTRSMGPTYDAAISPGSTPQPILRATRAMDRCGCRKKAPSAEDNDLMILRTPDGNPVNLATCLYTCILLSIILFRLNNSRYLVIHFEVLSCTLSFLALWHASTLVISLSITSEYKNRLIQPWYFFIYERICLAEESGVI